MSHYLLQPDHFPSIGNRLLFLSKLSCRIRSRIPSLMSPCSRNPHRLVVQVRFACSLSVANEIRIVHCCLCSFHLSLGCWVFRTLIYQMNSWRGCYWYLIQELHWLWRHFRRCLAGSLPLLMHQCLDFLLLTVLVQQFVSHAASFPLPWQGYFVELV